MKVVALDLSLTATGIAVTHDQVGEPRLAARTVSPRKRQSPNIIDHQRLHETFQAVAATLECEPDLVVIEWLPLVKGTGDASLRVAELHGAIKHYLWSHKHRYVDVRPQELKTYATGNANADKLRVKTETVARYGGRAGKYGVHINTFDEADAFTLLALALDAYGQALTDKDDRPIYVPPECRIAVGKVAWPVLGGDR